MHAELNYCMPMKLFGVLVSVLRVPKYWSYNSYIMSRVLIVLLVFVWVFGADEFLCM